MGRPVTLAACVSASPPVARNLTRSRRATKTQTTSSCHSRSARARFTCHYAFLSRAASVRSAAESPSMGRPPPAPHSAFSRRLPASRPQQQWRERHRSVTNLAVHFLLNPSAHSAPPPSPSRSRGTRGNPRYQMMHTQIQLGFGFSVWHATHQGTQEALPRCDLCGHGRVHAADHISLTETRRRCAVLPAQPVSGRVDAHVRCRRDPQGLGHKGLCPVSCFNKLRRLSDLTFVPGHLITRTNHPISGFR